MFLYDLTQLLLRCQYIIQIEAIIVAIELKTGEEMGQLLESPISNGTISPP